MTCPNCTTVHAFGGQIVRAYKCEGCEGMGYSPRALRCEGCGRYGHSRRTCKEFPFYFPLEENYESIASIEAGHPTLLQVADSEAKVMDWEIRDANFQKRVRPIGNALIVLSVVVFITGVATAALVGASQGVAIGFVWMILWFAGISIRGLGPGPRPAPLAIVPYTKWENARLCNAQEKEPFRAVCACPGCGDVDAHSFLQGDEMKIPDWATVIRQCDTCQRQWAQS